MKYKLIAIDMDGTFLNEERKISEKNLTAVKKAVELGAKVVICSGRIPSLLKFIVKDMPKNQPIIAGNGSIILDHNHKEISFNNLDNSTIIMIIDLLRKDYPSSYYHFFDSDFVCSERFELVIENIYKHNMELPRDYRVELRIIDDSKEYIERNQPKISKFEIYDQAEVLQEIRKIIDDLFDVEIVSSGTNGIEITKKGFSKGSSLEVLAKHYGYSLEECIAVGNDENDLEMIKRAGMGIAVNNAKDYVKSVANYITKADNDHDAIHEVIEKFVG